jgi:REP element-mobilizing transposase RayT
MAIAFFHTWTTYGTWLPGDARGWFKRGRGLQTPDAMRELEASLIMTEDALVLDEEQRRIVEKTIADHCRIRDWELHAVNCRTNHVHVVVTADRDILVVREQFKAWCTRKLKEHQRAMAGNNPTEPREKWWTQRGWDEYVDDEDALAATVTYVAEGQGR